MDIISISDQKIKIKDKKELTKRLIESYSNTDWLYKVYAIDLFLKNIKSFRNDLKKDSSKRTRTLVDNFKVSIEETRQELIASGEMTGNEPTIAESIISASFRVATSMMPSSPELIFVSRRLTDGISSAHLFPSMTAATRGRHVSICSLSRDILVLAVNPTTSNKSGILLIKSSALQPTEPVEPRIAIRLFICPRTFFPFSDSLQLPAGDTPL